MEKAKEGEVSAREGGISQGISGISPRGGLVNCSVGWQRRRAGSAYSSRAGPEARAETGKGQREAERERSHKSRQSYGLKEAY